MRFIALILSPVLLLGAGCLSSQTAQTLPAESAQAVESAPSAPVQMTTYHTTGKVAVLFDAPQDWYVRQGDGGGFSTVVIGETKDAPARASLTIITPWPDDDGHRATYQEWLASRELTRPVDGVESAVAEFDAWEPSSYEGIVYTLIIDPQIPRYLRVDIPDDFDPVVARAFIRSVNPFATTSEQNTAVPVLDVGY